MVVGNAPEATDMVVIGAGPGGYTAALHAAKRGRDVILIDRGGDAAVGGVCLHAGCIPSKSLIEAAGLFHRSQHSTAMGVSVVDAHFSMNDFQTYKDSVTDKLTNGVRQKLKKAGVEMITGNAMFTNGKTLVVATDQGQARFLQFRDCVIATGSSPVSIPGFEFNDKVLDANAALCLTETPDSLAIIGAGYIGLELGQTTALSPSMPTVAPAVISPPSVISCMALLLPTRQVPKPLLQSTHSVEITQLSSHRRYRSSYLQIRKLPSPV